MEPTSNAMAGRPVRTIADLRPRSIRMSSPSLVISQRRPSSTVTAAADLAACAEPEHQASAKSRQRSGDAAAPGTGRPRNLRRGRRARQFQRGGAATQHHPTLRHQPHPAAGVVARHEAAHAHHAKGRADAARQPVACREARRIATSLKRAMAPELFLPAHSAGGGRVLRGGGGEGSSSAEVSATDPSVADYRATSPASPGREGGHEPDRPFKRTAGEGQIIDDATYQYICTSDLFRSPFSP